MTEEEYIRIVELQAEVMIDGIKNYKKKRMSAKLYADCKEYVERIDYLTKQYVDSLS